MAETTGRCLQSLRKPTDTPRKQYWFRPCLQELAQRFLGPPRQGDRLRAMGQAASEACGMLSGRRDHSLQAPCARGETRLYKFCAPFSFSLNEAGVASKQHPPSVLFQSHSKGSHEKRIASPSWSWPFMALRGPNQWKFRRNFVVATTS